MTSKVFLDTNIFLSERDLNYFITNNTKDFKFAQAKLPVVSAKEFMTIISKKIMKIYTFLLFFLAINLSAFSQTDGWVSFALTKFEAKYNEQSKEYFMYPEFPVELKGLVGKEVNLEGYYLPIDVEGDAYIILSKFPYSQCFFCGGAGPESIAEVSFKTKQDRFEADQYIRIKGKLKLNASDLEHGNFILEDAVVISK